MNKKKVWGKDVFTLLSWFELERVQQARVMVAGCGALGNEVLKNLALFGVGNIVVVDFDTIEYSNLTRSILFREEDADKGMYKAEVAARRVREINRDINIIPIVGRLDSDVGLGLYRSMDVVIGCLDSRLARLQLNRQCIRADVPWIDGGIHNLDGIVRVYRKGVNCYECELPEKEKDMIYRRISCSDVAKRNTSQGRVPTTPVVASVIGAIQVQEAMKIIHEKTVGSDEFTSLCGKWFCYEGAHMTSSVFNSALWTDECPSHEDWDPVESIPALGADCTVDEALSIIREHLKCHDVEINMRNNRFVDRIVTRGDNTSFDVMLPESKVADYIENEPKLYTRQQADLNQNVYENIGDDFPYGTLTLHDIGIPYWDVLQVSYPDGVAWLEMAKDSKLFSKGQ